MPSGPIRPKRERCVQSKNISDCREPFCSRAPSSSSRRWVDPDPAPSGENSMFYVKNRPNWERVLRLATSSAMAVGAYELWGTMPSAILAATAAFVALTAIFSFCPACALVGRRPRS